MITIRPAERRDEDAIWRIFHAVIAPGDTYVFLPDMGREEALAFWMASSAHVYVALDGGDTVGTYFLKPNQPGRGSHVSNAGFMVAPDAQARGVGRAMGEHCLAEARRLGFRAMQFNFVVSTNEPAVALWKKLGFQVIGTAPGAFRHPTLGFVDTFMMYRSLDA